MVTGMRVVALWRYPVKSMQGERLPEVGVGPLGLDGDRGAGVLDLATGLVLTARRNPPLLDAAAHRRPDGQVEVVLPDGRTACSDEDLSAWLGRPVRLEHASSSAPPTYEDEEQRPWGGPAGAFHDDGNVRVSLLGAETIARLGNWDVRRFRPNIVLEGDDEDALLGCRVRLGGVMLDVVQPVSRCVVVTRPQPDGVGRDLEILRTILRDRAGNLAVGAVVVEPGTVRVGDEIEVLP